MKKLGDLWHALKGLDQDTEDQLTHLETMLSADDMKHLRYLVKYRMVALEDTAFPASARILSESSYPVLKARAEKKPNVKKELPKERPAEKQSKAKNGSKEKSPAPEASEEVEKADLEAKETREFVDHVNAAVHERVWGERFAEFSKLAGPFLNQHLAPHLVGMDHIKEAAALQLVMPERFHILLLGDPGTGKTDILRAAADIAPKSSFGLGSGASKAGLSITVVGKERHEGILVLANGGLCCIDELNLMKADDRAALYNAMEKGFITYDKGSTHERFEADIRLLATANPKGDQFRGSEIPALKRQLPFDSALLSRFHLVFIVRRPSVKEFEAISRQVMEGKGRELSKEDIQFLRAYLDHARSLTVSIQSGVEDILVHAATRFKAMEKKLLADITPRLTKGLLTLAKAHARLELRTEATKADAEAAVRLVERSFMIH